MECCGGEEFCCFLSWLSATVYLNFLIDIASFEAAMAIVFRQHCRADTGIRSIEKKPYA